MGHELKVVRVIRDRQNPQIKQTVTMWLLSVIREWEPGPSCSGLKVKSSDLDLGIISMGTLYILQTLDVNEWAEVFNVCFPELVGHFEGLVNTVTKMSQSNIWFLSLFCLGFPRYC